MSERDDEEVQAMIAAKRRQKAVLAEVAAERHRQDEKWGEQNHDAGKWMLILAEEVGEAAKAALEGDVAQERAEYVQVAAVAVARIECIDRRGAAKERP